LVRRLGALLWTTTKIVSGVALVAGVALGVGYGAYRYALSSPRFAVSKIEIEGAVRLAQPEILALAGVEPGKNLFTLDTAKAEAGLLSNPWIREAHVERALPSGLHITLTEREAAALAVVGDSLVLVSPAGEPFKVQVEGDPQDLPVVTGVDAERLTRDPEREVERLATAMEILRQYRDLELGRIQPAQEVHLEPSGDVTLVIGKQGLALHLGKGPWKKKLLMAARVVGRLQRDGRSAGIVFLDNDAHPERVVARVR